MDNKIDNLPVVTATSAHCNHEAEDGYLEDFEPAEEVHQRLMEHFRELQEFGKWAIESHKEQLRLLREIQDLIRKVKE